MTKADLGDNRDQTSRQPAPVMPALASEQSAADAEANSTFSAATACEAAATALIRSATDSNSASGEPMRLENLRWGKSEDLSYALLVQT